MLYTVTYPAEYGEYPLFYFIPGGPEGVIPAEWYTDFLQRVVSHGFVVAAVDPFYPLISSSSDNHASMAASNEIHLEWV